MHTGAASGIVAGAHVVAKLRINQREHVAYANIDCCKIVESCEAWWSANFVEISCKSISEKNIHKKRYLVSEDQRCHQIRHLHGPTNRSVRGYETRGNHTK
jgi:hypothetical protein